MERTRNVITRKKNKHNESASQIKLLLCISIAATLTLVKLFCPSITSMLKDAVLPYIEADVDYVEAIAAIGRVITGGDISSNSENNVSSNDEKISKTDALIQNIELPEQGGYDAMLGELSTKAMKVGLAVQVREDDVPECVTTFLQSQSEYELMGFPEDVDYNMYELPFEKVAPLNGTVTSKFGYRTHPVSQTIKFHYGTDIGAEEGTDIFSFADGTVLYTADSVSYGNFLVIEHSDGYETLYAHCSSILVSTSDKISAGDVIARVGSTGNATGSCLHFEVKRNGVYLNSGYYI